MTEEDRVAIEQILQHWNQGWRLKDARLASQDYSDDSDWTNAFGMYRKGRAEIESQLSQVFALPFVMAGTGEVIGQSIRFIGEDVALVSTRVKRKGQLTHSGEPMETRYTSHQRVLVKTGGQWKILSHLISDARDVERS